MKIVEEDPKLFEYNLKGKGWISQFGLKPVDPTALYPFQLQADLSTQVPTYGNQACSSKMMIYTCLSTLCRKSRNNT